MFLFAAALALQGCAYPKPPRGGPGAPIEHAFTLVALEKDGRSLVEERIRYPGDEKATARCHFATPDGVVTSWRTEAVGTCAEAHSPGSTPADGVTGGEIEARARRFGAKTSTATAAADSAPATTDANKAGDAFVGPPRPPSGGEATPIDGIPEANQSPAEDAAAKLDAPPAEDSTVPAASMAEPSRLMVAHGPLPLDLPLDLPEIGPVSVDLRRGQGPRGTRGFSWVMRAKPERSVTLRHIPSTEFETVRAFRASRFLVLEVVGSGIPSSVVQTFDLHAAAAKILAGDAKKAFENKDLTRTDKLTAKSLKLDPDVSEVLLLRGCVFAQRKNLEETEKLLKRAFELDPRGAPGQARTDTCYKPLRGRPSFENLIAPMGRNAPP